MSSGLAVLGAWVELAVVVGVLGYLILRRSGADPVDEAGRDLADEAPARDSWEQ